LIGISGGLALTATTAGAAHAQTSAACDRACLTGFVDTYFAALIANNARALPQAARARITENSVDKALADPFWNSAEEIIFRFDIVNTRLGDTGTQTVIRNADGSKTMHVLRLKIRDGAISEAVVDEECGVVPSIVRFGLKAGAQSQSLATANDRLVAEFFAIKAGYIQEIQAVLFNLPDAKPTGWPADYGPGRGSTE
jgi:hypothetical protein